jgi:hypothetical protein
MPMFRTFRSLEEAQSVPIPENATPVIEAKDGFYTYSKQEHGWTFLAK